MKEKKPKWPSIGSIPVSEFEHEYLLNIANKQQGVVLVIRDLSERLGELQAAFDKAWKRLRERYDFPSEPDFKAWYDYRTESITWRKKWGEETER